MSRTPADPCFFILGYGRSGTTLFRRMLSAHPGLFVAPENDVFQRVPPLMRSGISAEEDLRELVASLPAYYERIYDLQRFRAEAAARLPLTTPELIVLLQGTSLIGRDRPNAQWGHKSPSEWPYITTWRQWFPNARFLHLVRHPHDATASMVQYQLQRYRTTPLVAIWQWRKAFRSIRRHGAQLGPHRYQLLRYEDLVSDPASILSAACRLLGVSTDFVADMVDFTSHPSATHIDEGVHMAKSETPLAQDRVGRSTNDYSPRQAAMLDHVCRNELRELGYQPRSGRPASQGQRIGYDAACASLDVAWAGLRATRRARGQL